VTRQGGKSAKPPASVAVEATSVVATTVRRRLLLVGLAAPERQHWATTLRAAPKLTSSTAGTFHSG